jgi:predicted outer membrane repeat protein
MGGATPTRRTSDVRLIGWVTLTVCAVLAAAAPAAPAKTVKANKLTDHAPNGCTKKDCTFREAVLAANDTAAKDKIVLRSGKTYKLSLDGRDEDAAATGDLDLLNPVKISARGRRATINAKGIDRVFHVPAPGTTAKLSNLSVKGGDATVPSGALTPSGGGIELDMGTLKLTKSVVRNNESSETGGGIAAMMGTLKVSKSTLSGNTANRGGGIYTATAATITGSTLSGNSVSGTGGGLKATAAGLELANDTIAGNEAGGDGGGVSNLGTATLNDVTIVRNTSATAGGGFDTPGTMTISNSLIVLNHVEMMGLIDDNCSGALMSGGHNLRGTDDTGCMGFTGTGDVVRANPKLGQLASNGGPTQTVALKHGSPAIGRGGDDSKPKDQRGVRRDAHPDIGAYERR